MTAGRVRTATVADIADLIALEQQSFPDADHFPARVWRHLLGPAAARGSAQTLVIDAARSSDQQRLVAATLVGLLRRTSRVARLYSLAVAPAQRGRGLAQTLLRAWLRALPARCAIISLEVRADNHPARALYDRLGFALVADLPGYYPDGAAGVRLRCERSVLLRALAKR